jgi:hypothetical protein
MSQPEIVQSDLAGEAVVARVELGGEDELYVTPTRTLVYRAEGLLSDEVVEEYSHGAERITVSRGRRKSKITLDYGLDGDKTITLPSSRFDSALGPIFEGVLKHNGVLEDDETVAQLFRFSELTIAVASERVVRHIGAAVWDQEFESYHYSDVTDLAFEDGSVNTSVVLTVNGKQERFKTPNDDARAVRSALESTLLSYWNVDSLEELRAAAAPDEPDGDPVTDEPTEVSFGDGPDPLFADPAEPEELPENATRTGADAENATSADTPVDASAPDGNTAEPVEGGSEAAADVAQPDNVDEVVASEPATDTGGPSTADGATNAAGDTPTDGASGATDEPVSDSEPNADGAEPTTGGFEGSGFEAAAPATDEQLREEVAGLREIVERQHEEITAQRELLEQLIEELRRGR